MNMRTWRRVHKWLGLVVFIQVFLWIGSGLLISWLDAATVAGSTTRSPGAEPGVLPADSILDVRELLFERNDLENIRLATIDGQPVYRVAYRQGVRLLNALDGQPFTIDSERAKRIAVASYAGSGELLGAQRFHGPDEITGFDGTAWRVDFDDALDTRVYIDAEDGRVLGHRNDRSALVEFLLKLHFMDYSGSHDFNNPLIIGFAFATLWLALSGVLVLVSSLRRIGLR